MNTGVGRPRIGQWYAHCDKGEIFQVIGLDEDSRTIEIQGFGGDLDELEEESWAALPLALAAPPEDWTGPVDDVERDDLGYSETEMTGADWSAPLQPLSAEGEDEGRTEAAPEDAGEQEPERAAGKGVVPGGPLLAERLR